MSIQSRIPVYQVDAFTDQLFGGNPAAVCPLDNWLPDTQMQQIALENNLSETAFFVPLEAGGYHIRWFTPAVEVDLCGHATLATSWVIFNVLSPADTEISFQSLSGELKVSKSGDQITLDFPARPPKVISQPEGLTEALGKSPVEFLRALKNIAVFDSAEEVLAIEPDMDFIANMDGDGLIITAPGTDHVDACDFVSRYFAPGSGIPEDPVTGSAHCTSVPYWGARLGKTGLHARQISKRGGELFCQWHEAEGRVKMSGTAVLFMEGQICL